MKLHVLGLTFVLAAFSTAVDAAQSCVATAAELDLALIIAQFDGDGSEIRIQQGSYALPNGTGTDTGYRQYSSNLTLSGGWNGDCSSRSLDPSTTVITGQGSLNSFIGLLSNASITLDTLTFQSVAGIQVGDRSAPSCEPIGQRITVRRVRVRDSVDGLGSISALLVASRCHQVRVENSLITGGQLPGLSLWCSAGMRFEAINNTVRDTASDEVRATNGFTEPCASYSLGLNRLENNVFGQLLLSDATVLARNNVLSGLETSGSAGYFPGSVNNDIVNPQLDADYRPIEPGSPVINAGVSDVPGGLPATDHAGDARVVGGIPDRGAFESSVLPPGPFVLTVTSSASSGAGTLRSAIDQANASPGLNLIQFDIPGACPRFITLTEPLPDITGDVIVNGYSQNGATFNSLDNGNNAQICVGLIASQVIDVPWAFRVAPGSSATFKVQGLAFGGYNSGGGLLGQAAIFLQDGSGHEIVGNQFGGLFHGLQLATNTEAVRLMNGATNALIGGDSPALRNTFSEASWAAIQVLGSASGGHEIINNYIGTTPSGTAGAGNQDGIRLIQSADNEISDNLISGNTRDAIYISGESATGNVIGGNRIGDIREGFSQFCGPSPLPPCPPPLGNRKGVFIENGADDNLIGAATQTGASNRIRFSREHGVRVFSGQQNRIWSNQIFDNGTQGNQLDIDLDQFGLDAIDADCGAAGDDRGNRGQNRPVLTLADASGGVIDLAGTLTSCTNSGSFDSVYRIQLFASSSCSANGHGPAQYFLGELNVVVSGPAQTEQTGSFSGTLSHPFLDLGGMAITATATDLFGNTSELSSCLTASENDGLFTDRFEAP